MAECRIIWYDAATGDILRVVRCARYLAEHQPAIDGQTLLLDGFPPDDASPTTHTVDLETLSVVRRA
jgi:hypothetical protein